MLMHAQGFAHKPFVFEDFARMQSASVAPQHMEEVSTPSKVELAPVGFTEEELLAAQKEAEAIGREKGKRDAQQELDMAISTQNAQILELLQRLEGRMEMEIAERHSAKDALRGQAAEVVLAIAAKLVGRALEMQPLGAVEDMVNECLTMLAGEGRLTITIAAELEKPLQEHLARVHGGSEQIVEVVADAAMKAGDCRIQWPGGKAERSQTQLQEEIEGIVRRVLSSASDNN